MSPVGHSLLGSAIGVLVMPRELRPPAKAAFIATFIVLGNLADAWLPFVGWKWYRISHSVFVNLAICLIAIAASRLLRSKFPNICRRDVLLGAAAACLSHLLLDTFYNHGEGVQILWPLSDVSVALPLPWFSHWPTKPPFFTWELFQASVIEIFFYAPFLAAAIFWRRFSSKHFAGITESEN
jgi:hypothetical protein